MSHKPEQWEVVEIGDLVFIRDEQAETIARIYYSATSERMVNADLIAAAPDLLAACEAAGRWIQAAMMAAPEPPNDDTVMVYGTLQAAIAKAKGE